MTNQEVCAGMRTSHIAKLAIWFSWLFFPQIATHCLWKKQSVDTHSASNFVHHCRSALWMVLISESPGDQGHMEDALSFSICFLFQPHVSPCLTSSFLFLQHWSASHSLLHSTYNHPPQPCPQLWDKNTQWFSFRKSLYHNHHPHPTPHATSTVCYTSHLLDWSPVL